MVQVIEMAHPYPPLCFALKPKLPIPRHVDLAAASHLPRRGGEHGVLPAGEVSQGSKSMPPGGESLSTTESPVPGGFAGMGRAVGCPPVGLGVNGFDPR